MLENWESGAVVDSGFGLAGWQLVGFGFEWADWNWNLKLVDSGLVRADYHWQMAGSGFALAGRDSPTVDWEEN